MTAKPHLPPSPIDEGKVTVTAIESVQPLDLFPDLLLVRVHTDAGLIDHGGAETVQAMLHDWMAHRQNSPSAPAGTAAAAAVNSS